MIMYYSWSGCGREGGERSKSQSTGSRKEEQVGLGASIQRIQSMRILQGFS